MFETSYLFPLLQLDQVIDWRWVCKGILSYYPERRIGRPTIDPIFLLKILAIQHFEGFRSVRFTCKQVRANATYRWFLGISPFQKIPDHSTISRFLWERLKGAPFWRALFTSQIITLHSRNYIANVSWAGDETELKANANKRRRQKVLFPRIKPTKNMDLEKINAFRVKHGKKPLQPAPDQIEYVPTNISPIDPDARLSVKHEERGRFAYFEDRLVDSYTDLSLRRM